MTAQQRGIGGEGILDVPGKSTSSLLIYHQRSKHIDRKVLETDSCIASQKLEFSAVQLLYLINQSVNCFVLESMKSSCFSLH